MKRVFVVALVMLVAAACASPAGAPEAPPSSVGAGAVATGTATPLASATEAAADSSTSTAIPPTIAVPTSAAPAPAGESLTLTAVGDISLARQVVDWMQADGPGYPFALVSLSGDIGFGNLEGPLTDRGEPWPKGYNFRTPPRFAGSLVLGHVGVVSLANNHSMDYGAIGLTDTIDALDAAGVLHAGAGVNALQAHIPAIVTVRGLRVAFLAYVATPTESGGFAIRAWEAGADAPGVAIGIPDAIRADVTAARKIADFVIVAVHAGDEYNTTPNATQRSLAQAAMDAGADAYIGAHAHVVQPIEQRGRQLIAWGLGNFVFDLDPVDVANIPPPRVSLVLKITLTKGAGVTRYEAIPVTLDAEQDRPRPATPDEAEALQRLITP